MEKYLKYKKVDIDWLDKIPEHWEVCKIKHILSHKKKTSNPNLNCGSISFGNVVYKDDKKVPIETKAAYQELLKGEFLINPLNLNFDLKSLRTALSDKDVVVSSGYIVLQANENLNKRYLKWLLHVFDVSYMKTLGSGVRQTLSYTHIKNSYFPKVSLKEQNTIANFLEYKLEKIERFIAKKEKTISRLNELKSSKVIKTITNGLDENVRMKTSNIQWLGSTPENWDTIKIKHILSHKKKTSNPDLNCGSISFGNVVYKDDKKVPIETKAAYQELLKGEFLINPLNLNFDLKSLRTALSDKDVVVSSGYIVLQANENLNKRYLKWLLHVFDILFMKTFGSGVRQTLNYNDIKNSYFPNVPLEEQNQIANYIDDELNKIDKIIASINKEIDMVVEYKNAIIAEVVTGKIDVREFKIPETEKPLAMVAEETINYKSPN
ncbi:type I restriction enzyme, S subunit [Tenacibaculum sp. MAR_2010_89]|uniref:restriction endonuclease subunit S n=1 Tax=Tenacibaculum sp. MAR_2010_89 TaxID=1250198 RepID=UPI000894AFEF|nr:restriction endonuclease subunit S [Tenacibaculum sp. MAR_2010_89]SED60018.1 type I restriction enzyme, S subunit [Tenacibaculum sp. MAR_2010_89]